MKRRHPTAHDMLQVRHLIEEAHGSEQKRRQMRELPTDLDRFNAAYEVARANQGNYADERRRRMQWQCVALLASACFVALGLMVMVFR